MTPMFTERGTSLAEEELGRREEGERAGAGAVVVPHKQREPRSRVRHGVGS